VKTPELVKIKGVHIQNVGFTSADFVAVVLMKNSNSINFSITKVDYTLYISDEFFGQGTTSKSQTLKENSETDFELPLKVKYSDLIPNASNILKTVLKGEKLKYRVEGTVYGDAEGTGFDMDFGLEDNISAVIR
jgi:LEA14-like dessication related protein